jgi:predicted DCC family thiol-disulfide oxidoreductase YuxK
MQNVEAKHIILFDGDCNYCTGWVLWLIKKDKHDAFRFSAMQLPVAADLMTSYGVNNLKTESVILISNKKIYTKSDAALRILFLLGGIYKTAVVLLAVPAFIRNYIYDFIAARRYRWFGKRASCFLPDENIRRKFL